MSPMVLIPLFASVSAATEPMYQGWYNGRNENKLHEAITVSREVKGVKDFTFTTLLFPVEAGQSLPTVERLSDGAVTVVFNGKEYRFSPLRLNA